MNDQPRSASHDLGQQYLSYPSSPDYRYSTTEQLSTSFDKPEDMKSTPRYSSTSLPSAPIAILEPSFACGVDWNDRAHFASHCWLPYSSNNSLAPSSSNCISCTNRKRTTALPLAQCPTCALILYATHLPYLPTTTTTITDVHHKIPPCRPSFFDRSTTEDISMQDRHYWSHVPILPERCMHCNRKSLSLTLYEDGNRTSIVSAIDRRAADSLTTNHIVGSSDQNMEGLLSGLVCLWCSRSCHRRCWESMSDDTDESKCDYGMFGNMIVRPQWLRRVAGSPAGFRAELTDGLETNRISPTPVLFFINKLSGGQKGEEIYRKLVRLLNPRQVFLLENDATIIQALNIYSSLANIRICVCGGDGTVGWVLSRLIEVFPSLENPPVSICPLGTGNDLSRVLGWGYQYDPKRLLRTLAQIPHAQPMALDRWQIKFETLEMTPTVPNHENTGAHRRLFFFLDHPKFVRNTNRLTYESHLTPPNMYFFSHISFGLDAAIALDFHVRRTRDPSKFTSPFKNKILYLNESRKYFNEFVFSRAWNLGSYIRLICDGQDLTDSIRSCHTLVLLNSPGFASGTSPWGRTLTNRDNTSSTVQTDDNSLNQISAHSNITIDTSTNAHRFKRQDYGDRKIEVLGLNTKQMALIHVGFRGHRIAQCSQVRLELNRPMSAQMDGEPFYLAEPIAVNVTHAGQVFVLRNENR